MRKVLCYLFVLLSILSFIHFSVFMTAMPFLIVGNLLELFSSHIPWFSVTGCSVFMTPVIAFFGTFGCLFIASRFHVETFKKFRDKLDKVKTKDK